MAKTNTAEYLRGLMKEAGIYQSFFEAQIADAADTCDMIESMRKKLGKNFVMQEMKTAGIDMKMVANPLIGEIKSMKVIYMNQLGALGLNYNGYKKKESGKTSKKDKMQEFFENRLKK